MILNNLALFAGAGKLPAIAVKNARQKGISPIVYHIAETTLDPTLKNDAMLKVRSVSIGEMVKTFQFLQEDKITHIVLLGKFEKQRLLQDVERDATAERLYAAAPDRRDDTLFHEFARLVAQAGIQIYEQKLFLDGCFLPQGVHTRLKPELPTLLADIEFGYSLSQRVGELDIGQTAIVYEKMILAVEAIEGTDAAISRAGAIVRKRGGVVCKSAKASQDARFDLPAVGIRTLETMAESGMQALVIEAEQTLVIDPKEFIAKADALGLIVVAQ
ncbi:MAG TPA: UDP-2,3-diacylglucosamine diphosphatase LpxI [Turneriella sp.]|nr:UDP-2,3-diacylglucosamine diphosphatase LpxI [Turneriella sp.]